MTRPRMVAPGQAYRVGRSVEWRARDALQEAGYQVVRSWMSQGPADLCAIQAGRTPLLVQVRRSLAITPCDWARLWSMAQAAGALALVAGFAPDGSLTWRRLRGPRGTDRRRPWSQWRPPRDCA